MDPIFIVNLEGKTIYSNNAASDMSGYTPDEILQLSVFDFVPESNKFLLKEVIKRKLNQPSTRTWYQIDLQSKDGTILQAEIRSTIIKRKGVPTAIHILVHDVRSQSKVREVALQVSMLQNAVLMARNIAQDFNNILMGILGNAEILETIPLTLAESQILMNLKSSAARATILTKELLSLGIEHKEIDVPKSDVNLLDVINESNRLVIERTISNCIIQNESDLPPFFGNKDQLIQVFNNLLINASQSMEKGGVISIYAKIFDTSLSKSSQYSRW